MRGTLRRVLVPLAVLVAAAGAGTGVAMAGGSGHPSPARRVLIDCRGGAEVRPAGFVLTCADANDYLSGLHWTSWRSAAFGTGVEHVNDCTPNCADGHFHRYPVLVALWRTEPLAHHPGTRYFSRLTEIYTGPRPVRYLPHRTYHPQTVTWDLIGT